MSGTTVIIFAIGIIVALYFLFSTTSNNKDK